MKQKIIGAFLLLVGATSIAFAQLNRAAVIMKPDGSIVVPPSYGLNLMKELLLINRPEDVTNVYMPAFMKERLGWINQQVDRVDRGKLVLQMVDNSNGKLFGEKVLMITNYFDGIPTIRVSGNRLVSLTTINPNGTMTFDLAQKNGFAVALVHESVHLERGVIFFTTAHSDEVERNEELRTARKVDRLVVAPLLAEGQPVYPDFVRLHDIFRECGYTGPCPAFNDYFRESRTPTQQAARLAGR